jgi:hypothetical protein
VNAVFTLCKHTIWSNFMLASAAIVEADQAKRRTAEMRTS